MVLTILSEHVWRQRLDLGRASSECVVKTLYHSIPLSLWKHSVRGSISPCGCNLAPSDIIRPIVGLSIMTDWMFAVELLLEIYYLLFKVKNIYLNLEERQGYYSRYIIAISLHSHTCLTFIFWQLIAWINFVFRLNNLGHLCSHYHGVTRTTCRFSMI